MSELKTKPNDQDVTEFLERVTSETKKKDSYVLLKLMEEVTGEPAKMWGPSIIGFGTHHYKYESGREGDWFLVGFSPRKASFSLYLMDCKEGWDSESLARLGKCKTGKACLYINKLADVDMTVLRELIEKSVKDIREAPQN